MGVFGANIIAFNGAFPSVLCISGILVDCKEADELMRRFV